FSEAFLLQIFASRIRKNYPAAFDFTKIYKQFDRAATVLSILLWLIVFFTNLNLYDTLRDELETFFMTPRQIGSYSFTLWGIILIFDRPLRIGDVVELGDKKGRVKEIGIRACTLLTPDGAEVIIPNGDILSRNIVNWTLTNNQIRAVISFAVEDLPNELDIK